MKLQAQRSGWRATDQCAAVPEQSTVPYHEDVARNLNRTRVLGPLRQQPEDMLRAELVLKDAKIKELEDKVQRLLDLVAERDRELAEFREAHDNQTSASTDGGANESGESPWLLLSGRSASSLQSSVVSKPSADETSGCEAPPEEFRADLAQPPSASMKRPSLLEEPSSRPICDLRADPAQSLSASMKRPSLLEEPSSGSICGLRADHVQSLSASRKRPSLLEDNDDQSRRSSIAELDSLRNSRRNSRRCSTLAYDGLPPMHERSKRRSNTLEIPMLCAAQMSPASSVSDDEPPQGTLKGLDKVLRGSPNHSLRGSPIGGRTPILKGSPNLSPNQSPRGSPRGGRTPVRFAQQIDCMSPRASMIEEKLGEKLEHATQQNMKLVDKLEKLAEQLDENSPTEFNASGTVRGAATLLEQISRRSPVQADPYAKAPGTLECIKKAATGDTPELTITVSVSRGRRQTDSSYSSMRSELMSERSSDPSGSTQRRSTSSSEHFFSAWDKLDHRRSSEATSGSAGRKGIIKRSSTSGSLFSSPRSSGSRSSRAGSSKAGSSGTSQGTPHSTPRSGLMGGLRQKR